MRALLQRVTTASVSIEGAEVARIGPGLVVFLGVAREDTEEDTRFVVDKVVNLRLFADEQQHFSRSALDIGAEFLIVSQFTLYADTRRGRRPDFTLAMSPEQAELAYQRAVEMFRDTKLRVATGRFREHMVVELRNDGPVTIMVDSADRHRPRRE